MVQGLHQREELQVDRQKARKATEAGSASAGEKDVEIGDNHPRGSEGLWRQLAGSQRPVPSKYLNDAKQSLAQFLKGTPYMQIEHQLSPRLLEWAVRVLTRDQPYPSSTTRNLTPEIRSQSALHVA